MALLDIQNLEVEFPLRELTVKALRGIDISLEPGERLGVVGESGAGKSMVAFSILNLISEPGRISQGDIKFEKQNLLKLTPEEMRKIRGDRISMIFQDPMMTLNPVLTIGAQMVETLKAHREISDKEAKDLSIEKLREVSIPGPETRFNAYPHELSGGLKQRVVIAIALLTNPSLIIADEPTTALDVTIQAEILALILELCKNHRMGLILITHDLAVVSQVTEKIIVMYAGKIIEAGDTRSICDTPKHPYTRGLLASLPENNNPGEPLNQIPGSMPTLKDIPSVGCAFAPRCAYANEICTDENPTLRQFEKQSVSCFHAGRIDLEQQEAESGDTT